MKIENQVCTLEQAKRLKELGVAQNSLCHWLFYLNFSDSEIICIGEIRKLVDGKKTFRCSAFTVAELGLMLPHEIHIPFKGNSGKKRKYPQYIHYFKQLRYSVNYTGGGSRELLTQRGDTEAEARAAMLIYLLENNLITADEVNARL